MRNEKEYSFHDCAKLLTTIPWESSSVSGGTEKCKLKFQTYERFKKIEKRKISCLIE